MKCRRAWGTGLAVVLAAAALVPGCNRRKPAEVNAIVPAVTINRPKAPLGSAVEVTYTWTVEPTAKKLTKDYRAFVHFLDSHKVVLFTDDHIPTPAPTTWEPGKTYTYRRTVFIPVYPYVGESQVVIGLYQGTGRGERVGLKGEDVGLQAYKVAKIDLLPRQENIYLVYKDGWHSPESSPQNPSQERTWTKREGLVSFKNPKKDVILYLEADTNFKAFTKGAPSLTISVNNATGLVVPIESSDVFMKKVRIKAADLGTQDWVDLRLTMSDSFVPKTLGINQDDRELGLMVYHLFVGEEEKLGKLPTTEIVDAGPVKVPAAVASKTDAKGKPAMASTAGKPAAKPATVPPAKAATASPKPSKS